MSSFDKKEKWNRIKSKGKKRYVLKSLFYYEVFILLGSTVYMFVFDKKTFNNIPEDIFTYLIIIIFYMPVEVWVGNNSWNAKKRKFEK
jgi:hypothetical protein